MFIEFFKTENAIDFFLNQLHFFVDTTRRFYYGKKNYQKKWDNRRFRCH